MVVLCPGKTQRSNLQSGKLAQARCEADRLSRERPGCEETNLEAGNLLPLIYCQPTCTLTYGRYHLYLLHCSEHLISTPFRKPPVVIILLDTTDANGAIGAAASAQESSSGKTTFLAIETWLGRGDNVPVKWSVVTLGPTIIIAASAKG